MEIRIVITDAGRAGGSERSIHIPEGAGNTAPADTSAGLASHDTAPMPVQATAGAIDAGPAPAAGAFYQPGAPQPFVAQRAAVISSQDESGGAAPGSGAGMETSTAEVQHG